MDRLEQARLQERARDAPATGLLQAGRGQGLTCRGPCPPGAVGAKEAADMGPGSGRLRERDWMLGSESPPGRFCQELALGLIICILLECPLHPVTPGGLAPLPPSSETGSSSRVCEMASVAPATSPLRGAQSRPLSGPHVQHGGDWIGSVYPNRLTKPALSRMRQK